MIDEQGAGFTASTGSGRWSASMSTSSGGLPLWVTLLLAVGTLALEVLADNRPPPPPPPLPVLECAQACVPREVLEVSRDGCVCDSPRARGPRGR